MKKNMGTADRVIRTALALAIVVLYLTGAIGGTLAIILGILALAFVASSFFGWCPSYAPFGISTRKEPPNATGAS